MKTTAKRLVLALAAGLLVATTLSAKTTGLKTAANQLQTIDEEMEQPVNDVVFTTEETVRYTRLNVVDATPATAVAEELPVADISFTAEEVEKYTNNRPILILTDLVPVAEEVESAIE